MYYNVVLVLLCAACHSCSPNSSHYNRRCPISMSVSVAIWSAPCEIWLRLCFFCVKLFSVVRKRCFTKLNRPFPVATTDYNN